MAVASRLLCSLSQIDNCNSAKTAQTAKRRERGEPFHGLHVNIKARSFVSAAITRTASDAALAPRACFVSDMDVNRFARSLRLCADAADLQGGYGLHACIVGCGFDSDRYLGNLLILMYGSCCNLEAALVAFHKIPACNVYSWNILINAYARNGSLNEAKSVFTCMTWRNVESWNAMISASAQHGRSNDALQYYSEMLDCHLSPDNVTFISALDACADITALVEGLYIHACTVSMGFSADVVIGTALINMYGKCGDLDTARSVFAQLSQHDVIMWNAMIDACNANSCSIGALTVFDDLRRVGIQPDRPTFLGVLDACADLRALASGWVTHALIVFTELHRDVIVENALVTMYSKCKSLENARHVFCKMLYRNVISWSAMISAYVSANKDKEAMELFQQMVSESVSPNEFIFSTILDACTNLTNLAEGRRIHADVICSGIEVDCVLEIALINMYGKCGSLVDARAVFNRKFEKEICYWNAKILACILNGYDREASQFLAEMQSKGILPNKNTFQLVQL